MKSPPSKIVLLTPLIPEFHAAREAFGARELENGSYPGVRMAEWRRKGLILTIVQCGLGDKGVKSVLPLLSELHPDLLIDSGSCGGLNPAFPPGSLVMAGEVVSSESRTVLSMDFSGFEGSFSDSGYLKTRMLEVPDPVLDQKSRDEFQSSTGAGVCSMETYAVAEWARDNAVKCFSLRVVTDRADENTGKDFRRNLRNNTLLLYRAIKQILSSLR